MKHFVLLLILLFMTAFVSNAQPDKPLSLPRDTVNASTDVPVITYPANGTVLSTDIALYDINQVVRLAWTDVYNASKYILKFVDYHTGEVIKHTVNPTYENYEGCQEDYQGNYYCSSVPAFAGWLWELRHNHTYVWRVFAKFDNGVTVRSTARNFSVRLVEKPISLSPSGDSQEIINTLAWESLPRVKSFTVVIKNLATNVVIHKGKALYDSNCFQWSGGLRANCSYVLPDDVVNKFNNGKTYLWTVKAKSYNKDKMKSDPVTYTFN